MLPSVKKKKKLVNINYNFYTGNFDFSDDKQKAIFWISTQNENLERNTFLGNAFLQSQEDFITENNAAYVIHRCSMLNMKWVIK